VWILGHVLSGWDGTNPLQNPTNLCRFYTILSSLLSTKVDSFHASLSNVGALADICAIGFNCSVSVDRFSPHGIASTSGAHTVMMLLDYTSSRLYACILVFQCYIIASPVIGLATWTARGVN
jgi:hypothetical protein